MIIRKISIGADYKSSMHYIAGQEVLGGSARIHLIEHDSERDTHKVYIEKDTEVYLWKEFSSTMPVSIEFNISF